MENTEQESIKVIMFNLGNEVYGVPIDQVLSIEHLEPITRVPNAAHFVEGVMNLRGLIIPVIDVRKRFGLAPVAATKDTRVIVVETDDLQVGMLVDTAKEVTDINVDSIEKTPEIIGGLDAGYINGVAKLGKESLMILLNLDRVLSDQDLDNLKLIEE
ncbi:purine-binding chemotaxis protein CheW [Sporolactobacillus shoreae]|uniref:Purine-binding chemotaxis protein CheW n=1 Tax=Sporolactobacillus shoreae TaxID=1465501 RepID=A0A4Z0GVG9_9BACL|nr:chemotaxis protein CheW [Sporolactobacillus shoreae]TGB00302.1 purine-binding chemotaxis protein CheW [Sporolactobacillus shoreae]